MLGNSSPFAKRENLFATEGFRLCLVLQIQMLILNGFMNEAEAES